MIDDVRRLLDPDGLADGAGDRRSAPATGIGIDELQGRDRPAGGAEEVHPRPASRPTCARVPSAGRGRPVSASRHRDPDRAAELEEAFADAAGVPMVVEAVERPRGCGPTGRPAGR